MHILLTGGTGLIGRHLISRLLVAGHHISVITRDIAAARVTSDSHIDFWPGFSQRDNLNDIDAIINLAGEPIASKRWTRQQKQRLCESRWQITAQLAALINASAHPPSVLISASATGYYGDTGEQQLTEDAPAHDEFTHQLCARWEALALDAASDHTRVCLLRTGIVLAKQGGALAKMVLPFRLGLGGPMGPGTQYLPWIHLDDTLNAILWLLDNTALNGPFNLASPHAVRNAQFAATLGQVMHRPAHLRLPAWVLKLIMGESSILLLSSQHVIPHRLESSGFSFRWTKLDKALADVV